MFGGFKATLNLLGGKKNNDVSELSSDMFVTGAYRVNKEDSYGFSTQDSIRPRKQLSPPLRPAKSTTNLVQPKTADPNVRKSTPAVSSDPRGAEQGDSSVLSRKETKKQEKEQKKVEKQRLADQKKQVQEQAKREKLIKEQAKKAQKSKAGKKVTKAQAPTAPKPQPTTLPQTQPQPQSSSPAPQSYSTNTLDSSISRSSGPPPYSVMPKSEQGSKDKTGNVVYSKPADTGSWDIISQHREQISRPAGVAGVDSKRKQVVMDLNYNFGASNNKENSDA